MSAGFCWHDCVLEIKKGREKLDWRRFNKDAAEAGKMMGCCNDKNSRLAFDKAIEALVNFEKKHGIRNDYKKPTDFYY